MASDQLGGRTWDILYVITDLEVGGVPLHLLRLARSMRDRGRRVAVVSLARPGPVERRMREAGIEVLTCRAGGRWDARVFIRLARMLRKMRPSVVHALLFHANLAAKLAARLAGIPRERVLCEIQTVEIERPWHLSVDRWTHRLCRLTIGNSPSVIEHLATQARIPRPRLRLVRGGVDVEPLQAAPPADRAILNLSSGDRVILWAGRLDPIKGLEELLEALARIQETRSDIVLLLAGDGALRGALEAKAVRLGVADRVRFLGVRADVPSLMKLADVFVFPSKSEGLPNALLEAMACGCAVVTTDAPGCRDVVTSGSAGLTVPVADPVALATATLRILEDRDLALRLGRAAMREVSEKWHFAQTLEAYARLYEEVCV